MENTEGSTSVASDTHVAPQKTVSRSIISKITDLHAIPRLIGYARITYLVGLVLALLIVSPVDWVPTPLLKISLYTVVLGLAAILFILGGGIRELWRAPGRLSALVAALALPVAYLLSWVTAGDHSVALIGIGNETDTVFFVVVATVTFILGFGLFRTLKSVKQLVNTFGLAIIIAAVFQYLSIVGLSAILPAAFSDHSVNLVGKWNDFGMFISIGILFLLARIELGDDEGWKRYAAMAGLILLFILVVLVQFNFIWWFTIVGAAVIGLLKWMPRVHSEAGLPVKASRIPWFAGAAGILCAVFLIVGTSISALLPGFLSIPSLEVRPAISTTYQIGNDAHQGFAHTLTGTGPNSFTNAWINHKPSSVNLTPFWNIDFLTGYSVLTTAFATVGLLGMLAWLVPIALVLMSLWTLRGINRLPLDDRLLLLSLGLASVFLWIGVAFYAGSQDMILLAFAAVGALWATEAAVRRPLASEATSGRTATIGRAAIAFVLVVLALWPAFTSTRQMISYSYQQQGAKLLSQGDIMGAAAATDQSQRILVTGDNLRLGISIDMAQMQKLAQSSTTPATIDAMRTQFQAALQAAIAQGQEAARIHPNDYQAYAQLGQVYEFLVPLKVQGAYESGQAAYKKSMEINPTNPTLPLLLARLEATYDLNKNLAEVQKLLQQSLTIKQNYVDAFLFAEQLAVAQNDLPSATRAAEAVVASSPQNPALWFQLGLFYYAAQNWADAQKGLQNAVSLQSDYANAKYFLGLTDYKLGQKDDAIKQFQDLQVSNPDNAEVKLILSNLQAGKDPFADQTPPQPPPEKRPTAPVDEKKPNQ